jgi:poly[(R)-3-hydroxyalkanoate] polymerase subunit PhaC
VNPVGQLTRLGATAIEFANIILTAGDAPSALTPREIVWTHRNTTLFRYRSDERRHAVPVLLVFALINRPDIFDLRPGNSFVEHLLAEGFDVFLLDWGEPDNADADLGLEAFVLDELHWAVRETLRAAAAEELSMLGWCIGGTLAAMYAALEHDAVRNLILLTTPIDTASSRYTNWVGRDSFDPAAVTDVYPSVPGELIDFANKLLKPVTNYWTTYRRLWEDVYAGNDRRVAYQAMARWVADNPSFPGRAYREWITWMYKENALVRGRVRLRGRRVDLSRMEANLLVVTAGADHIAPREGTVALLDLVSSADVTHFDRPGGHIGLMIGSNARHGIWPDIVEWLEQRSAR